VALNIASALLAAACGFGAAVWLLTAHFTRRAHLWHSISYLLVAASYAAIGVLLTARIIGRPLTPAPVISLILLAVVFVVPSAIQLVGYLKARGLVNEQRADRE
jgi:hypothetical protein